MHPNSNLNVNILKITHCFNHDYPVTIDNRVFTNKLKINPQVASVCVCLCICLYTHSYKNVHIYLHM